MLWTSWEALVPLLPSMATAKNDTLPKIATKSDPLELKELFLGALVVRLQSVSDADWRLLSRLQTHYPRFPFVLKLQAEFQYNKRCFDEAQRRLEHIINDADPFLLGAYELLSNVYYIKDDAEKLALLAQKVTAIDALTTEACCVVGNFYSLRNEHEKAIQYFQRALRLDGGCLAAWTLMGHEYLELKNTTAAIHSYNSAVRRNSSDYRAWYGLGQTYELLKLPSYAAFYFRRAVECKPTDSRMWLALAAVHEACGDVGKAIETLQASLRSADSTDHVALLRLGKLLIRRNSLSDAYQAYLRVVQTETFWSQSETADISAVLWFLALHSYRLQKYTEAHEFCVKVFDYASVEAESAAELLKELQKKLGICE